MDLNKKIIIILLVPFFLTVFFSKTAFACNYSACAPGELCQSSLGCSDCPWCVSQPRPTQQGVVSLGFFKGVGPLGEFLVTATNAVSLVNKLASIAIGLFTTLAFFFFIIQFFTAGLKWVSSGGDAKQVEAAGKQITGAIIGLIIVVAALFIVKLFEVILGISILNPLDFIINLWQ